MGLRILASIAAVLGAALLTLACTISLVQATIQAVAVHPFPLRVLAVSSDFVLGTGMLLGCIYVATHLAVGIVGVGKTEFPELQVERYDSDVRSDDSAKI